MASPKVNLWFAQLWALAMLTVGELAVGWHLPTLAFVGIGGICTLGPLLWAAWELHRG